jgi:hypothetical protein
MVKEEVKNRGRERRQEEGKKRGVAEFRACTS